MSLSIPSPDSPALGLAALYKIAFKGHALPLTPDTGSGYSTRLRSGGRRTDSITQTGHSGSLRRRESALKMGSGLGKARLLGGEGNGTALQHSRLESPMDAGAWSGAVKGSRRAGHDPTSPSLVTVTHWRRKRHPTPVFLPGDSQGRGAWWAAVCGLAQRRTRLKRLSSSRLLRQERKTCKLLLQALTFWGEIEDQGSLGHGSTFAERCHPIAQGLLLVLSPLCVRSSICLLQVPHPRDLR